MIATPDRGRWRQLLAYRPELRVEWMALLSCLFLALFSNTSFWRAALAGYAPGEFGTWRFAFGTFVALAGLHLVLFLLVLNRWTVKPLLAAIFVATAMAAYYQDRYGVFLDVDMLRNILHTEYKEARELITPGLFGYLLLYAVLPILILLRLRIATRRWSTALWLRAAALCVTLAVTAFGMVLAFRDLSILMRNHKEVRYLVTPGNYLYASVRAGIADVQQGQQALLTVGADARLLARAPEAPARIVVVVVGETVRADHWGLNGYARDTTPQLRELGVVNFPDVGSCGTATEVSLPCMFSAVGRRDYDEARIRGSESLLHVVERAGVKTLWRDNQTGCKGVCSERDFQQLNALEVPGVCKGGLCYDEILLDGLQAELDRRPGDVLLVLHPLGNHGPSYFARYPESFRRYAPTCDTAELRLCSSEQIINSYDNAVLYGDHVVAETIRLLQKQTRDSALIYVSDHGESLGEHNLYLHGIPYAIAPRAQTTVPMVAWLSPALEHSLGIEPACMDQVAAQPAAHDHLFHSVLGLFDVLSRAYEPRYDLFRDCRTASSLLVAERASAPDRPGPLAASP